MQANLRPVYARAFLLGAFLACSSAAGLAARAPAPAGQDSSATRARDEQEKDLKRILVLSDGSVLRARARQHGDVWEIMDGSGWRTLPPGSVERARLEREVLAQARELARAVPAEDQNKRVALADWMLREGLAQEALRELDLVLETDPDQESAVALLAKPPVPVRLSILAGEDQAEILRQVAGTPPSARELGLRRLSEIAAEGELLALQRENLGSHSPRLRRFAALGLRRLFPGEEVRGLLTRAVLDGSEDVRREAALSLKAVGDPAVILPAVRALDSQSSAVRENAIQALGTMGYPAAVPALVSRLAAVAAPQGASSDARPPRSNIFVGRQLAYVQDFDVEVAQGSAIADPMINVLVEGSVLDVRVIGTTIYSAQVEARNLRRSLASLVGEEKSTKGWLEWWEQHAGDWGPRTSTPITGG